MTLQTKIKSLFCRHHNQEKKVSENKIPVFTAESIPQSCSDNLKKLADAISKEVKNMLERDIITPKNEEGK